MNFCCNGCSSPSADRPSTVATSRPSASTPNTRQEQTRSPSKVILHAPQSPVPQPSFTPVSPTRLRRAVIRLSSVGQANCTGSPLTVVDTKVALLIGHLLLVERQSSQRA